VEERADQLDQVPAWIQGAAAVIQAAVAVLLWWVTKKYVRLTHRLSEAAENQLALMQEAELHRRRADLVDLTSLARRLVKSLGELPAAKTDPDAQRRLLFASLWRLEEVGELRSLAAKAGRDLAEKTELLTVDLNWMLERIHPVRSEPRGQGFEMGSFAWDEHAIRVARAEEGLVAIADSAIAAATATTTTLNAGRPAS